MRHEIFNKDDFKRVLLILDFNELKFAISNIAFAQGDVARVHDNYGHDLLGDRGENYMHQWKDVCEDGNIERVKSIIGIALSDVEQMLYRFTATIMPHDGMGLSNHNTSEPLEYVIELKASPLFSATTADYMLKLINEYIVDSVLEDWASITYPEATTMWSAKKQATENKLRHASHYNAEKPTIKSSII